MVQKIIGAGSTVFVLQVLLDAHQTEIFYGCVIGLIILAIAHFMRTKNLTN